MSDGEGSPDPRERIRELFDEVANLDPQTRKVRLDEACQDDLQLRGRIEALLAAFDARDPGLRELLEELRAAPHPGAPQTRAHVASAPSSPGPIPSKLQVALRERYEIEREIGAGGMATVFQAEDRKHRRKVALKVLHPELAAVIGADRFLREIRLTANLQHPHIVPLFDSGQAEGFLYFVMPYVKGESLRDRLNREKLLPVGEAVRITSAVASALGYAHGQGVIHRDVKPANILLSQGEPVVADFGIALAARQVTGSRLTESALALGTAEYMSPEQATGAREVDRRSDVYSLGCVMYEMLAGQPPNAAATLDGVLANIQAGGAPPLSQARPSVPPNVEAAIAKAIERIPADRFASAEEFATALEDPSFRHRIGTARIATEGGRVRSAEMRRWKVGAVSATAIAVLMGAALLRTWLRAEVGEPDPHPIRFVVDLPPGHSLSPSYPVLSADGRFLAYRADSAGVPAVFVRSLDGFETVPVEHSRTAGLTGPSSFSPDGTWLALRSEDRLVRIRWKEPHQWITVRGQTPSVGLELDLGQSWGTDGSIAYALDLAGGIERIPASGGEPEILTEPNRAGGEIGHGLPQLLPQGRGVLFSVLSTSGWRVAARSFESGRTKTILPQASIARYVRSGYLVYSDAAGLWAAPFDLDALEMTGTPVPLVTDFVSSGMAGGDFAYFDVSDAGTLAYLMADAVPDGDLPGLVLVDRAGNVTRLRESEGWQASFSQDGDRLAIHNGGIWVQEARRDGTRMDLGTGLSAYAPLWTPDGSRIVYSSYVSGPADLYWTSATGNEEPEPLILGDTRVYANSWSPDGRCLAFTQVDPTTGHDLWILPMDGDRTPTPLVRTEANEYSASFSPDGRWLAYTSDQGGQSEVYVMTYPDGGSLKRISTDGGRAPAWRADGAELYYRNGNRLMVAERIPGEGFLHREPRVLFEHRMRRHPVIRDYDVAPDGQRFVVTLEGDFRLQLRVVVGFLEELSAADHTSGDPM